jgi:hypothetical protein
MRQNESGNPAKIKFGYLPDSFRCRIKLPDIDLNGQPSYPY